MALGRLENGNQTDTSAKDGFGWRCANQRCPKRRTYRTIRAGSFFERSRITIIQMFQYLRDVCSTKLLSTPVELGGPGVIVQIDESLFNHKSKYNRGRRASKEQWVFGLADTSSKPAITTWKLLTKEMPQLFYLLYNVL